MWALNHFHQKETTLQFNKQLYSKAQQMHQLAENIRDYTALEITPLLAELSDDFYPQSVGSYSATQTFNSHDGAEVIHQVALQNTQIVRYQANVWQQELINRFKSNNAAMEITDQLTDAKGRFFVFTKPIKSNEQVLGVKVIKIRIERALLALEKANINYLIQIGFLSLVVWLIMNVFMHLIVFKPLQHTSQQAKSISLGNSDITVLKGASGGTEINTIRQSFNRMQNSLKAAMSHLK
ncbi:c-type heme family protein [Marinicella marina]|uniref:c-type heme family protein n=1 Tax=Marinicella marina TaxID=2996016 RepID=UPI002260EC16|nr:DUF3365 domain-containing protein [Marinicella marina]MDJ1138941.1 DUF3365 domain-containing protein [Marinicella marina]